MRPPSGVSPSPPALADRYAAVLARVADAATRAGRDPSNVTLVAVSKTWPAHVLADAVAAGVGVFGENRAQELREKVTALGDAARWHFVGPLQSNKVRHVVGTAELVHSVDRYGLAEAIARRAHTLGIVQDVLIEVNVAGEATKHGVEPAAAVSLAEEVAALDGIAVRGLMTIPPRARDPEETRPYFRELVALRDLVARSVPGATELSMGMSADFETAIEEGATIVRVGEAIFGPRNPR
ncbi:MAG TPA: YggS family pyridoxal phosphate-dependent enzyme [Actinomycetota bacterium]|nr:YggS family pyridoxal phosphate-dependent enzyme [Actinomycetota bacterium]